MPPAVSPFFNRSSPSPAVALTRSSVARVLDFDSGCPSRKALSLATRSSRGLVRVSSTSSDSASSSIVPGFLVFAEAVPLRIAGALTVAGPVSLIVALVMTGAASSVGLFEELLGPAGLMVAVAGGALSKSSTLKASFCPSRLTKCCTPASKASLKEPASTSARMRCPMSPSTPSGKSF